MKKKPKNKGGIIKEKLLNLVSLSKCHDRWGGPKIFLETYPRRKTKETADAGRGRVFGDPLPMVSGYNMSYFLVLLYIFLYLFMKSY